MGENYSLNTLILGLLGGRLATLAVALGEKLNLMVDKSNLLGVSEVSLDSGEHVSLGHLVSHFVFLSALRAFLNCAFIIASFE